MTFFDRCIGEEEKKLFQAENIQRLVEPLTEADFIYNEENSLQQESIKEDTSDTKRREAVVYVLPTEETEEFLNKKIRSRLSENVEIENIRVKYNKDSLEQEITISFHFYENLYKAKVRQVTLDLQDDYELRHPFSEEEKKAILNSKKGIKIEMVFSEYSIYSYNALLKLAACVYDKILVVIDEGTKRLLSGDWVKNRFMLPIQVDMDYLYRIETVKDDKDNILVYTMGLERFGLNELEIIDKGQHLERVYTDILQFICDDLLRNPREIEDFEADNVENIKGMEIDYTYVGEEKIIYYYQGDILALLQKKRTRNVATKALFIYCDEECEEEQKIAYCHVLARICIPQEIYLYSYEDRVAMLVEARGTFYLAAQFFMTAKRPVQFYVYVEREADNTNLSFNVYCRDWMLMQVDQVVDYMIIRGEVCSCSKDYIGTKIGERTEATTMNVLYWMLKVDGITICPDSIYLLDKVNL